MEVPVVVESVKKYQMMNEHMFDHLDGKNIDLVYENFNSIFMALIDQLEWSETCSYENIFFLKGRCKLLKTFSRGMLKWCIEEEGETVNTSLVDILKGIESYFVCAIERLLSCPIDSTISCLEQILRDAWSMETRIAKAYLLVVTSSPPTHFMNIIIKEESVVEFIDQVLENLHCASTINYRKTAPELREKLSFLRNLFHVTKDWINPEKWQGLLICVEMVVEKIACFSYLLFHYNVMRELYEQIEAKSLESEMRTVILRVVDSSSDPFTHEVLLGYVDCVKKNLTDLINNREIFVSTNLVKVQFRILQDELRFLKRLVISYPSKEDEEGEKLLDIRVNFEAVARNIGSFVYRAVEKKNKIMFVHELTVLVEKVKFIKAQVMDTIFLIDYMRFGWKFPQTDQLGNLNYLINNLKEYLMNCDMIMDWKDQVQIILDDLIMFESFLKKIRDNNIILDYELEDLSIRINNSSYEADYLINSLYPRVCPVSYRSVLISDFIERLKIIKTDVREINEKKSISVASKDHNHVVSQSVLPTTDAVIGFEDEMKLLKERLVSDLKKLDAVSITGMPGVGKTTLAKKMYEDPLIASHFQLRAWCCVSQEYNKKDMLLDILSYVLELNDLIRRKSDEDLSVILHQQLTGRRYLIVVDNVWKIEVWDDLRFSFPNNYIGSRIMLTSRNKVIGKQAKYHTSPLELRFLTDDESWDLLKLIKTDVLEIVENKSMDKIISEDRNHVVSLSVLPTTDVVIGFEDEIKLLKERLVSDLKELDVVSITGMPGLGKTTLAKKVFEDPLIASHFQLRAWCCVSQEYNKKDMLLDILSSVLELNDLIRRKSAKDLSEILHKQLFKRRYLILVDDVWNIEAWDDLRTSFPNNNIGSRIMLTSRNKVIGIQAIYHTKPLELRFLTDDESWDLLKAKVFRNKPCPSDFLHVGKKIAGKCKGLPLGVVVVAGLLLKSAEEELGFWKQVEENLSSHIASDSQGHMMEVLELSYKFLPNYLRPLFLYLGAFPEDKEIPAENLTWLWIAEGFIQKSELMTLETQARKHLMDLIDRSLIMVAERSYNGNVKACRVHDLLHEFCLRTAEKDSFLQQIHVYDESVLPDSKISQWRLSMCLKRTDLDAPSPSITPPLHSFLFFNMNTKFPLKKDVVKSVLRMSKLLRVLHLESTTIEEESDSDLMMMVHLRYVSVRAGWRAIPSSIYSFWQLETLIIKGVRGELIVPAVIWTLVKLRHLHINDRACFEFDDDDDASKLENLETLSTPVIYRGHEKKLIRRLPNLRKLRCIFFDPKGDWNNNCHFPNLKPFDQLESLKLSYNDIERSSSSFILPALSLKKLTLSKFRLQWDAIATIVEKLPNLEVLKLCFGSVVGEVWNMGDVEFLNLKFLKLQSLNIKTWSASPENFPSLEKLVLERCKQLKEIPDSLGDFYSLEKIELLWCNSSAAKSAKQIQDEQEDAGNQLLKVHVYPPDLDL